MPLAVAQEESGLSPSALLGIPGYDKWYPGQFDVLDKATSWFHSPARFLGEALPAGSGKTLSTLLLHSVVGVRTVVLTASKGLQQQYARDSGPMGGVDVRGQNNFDCIISPGLKADEGPCHDGINCDLKKHCPYRTQLETALRSNLVITNYAYWLAQTNFGQGLGDVKLLVCDEASLAIGAMENYLTLVISNMDVQVIGSQFPPFSSAWDIWQSWAADLYPTAQERATTLDVAIKKQRSIGSSIPTAMSKAYRYAKSLVSKLERLGTVSDDWIIQRTQHGYRFVPKWVSPYSSHLFQKVPKIVLMSAILSQKTCDYLGVDDGGERDWIDMDSYFPPQNTQIWHIPTARINFRTDDVGSTQWVSRIDQIIQRRLDRKGIVFTVSYERARMLMSRSRFKDIMLMHSTSDVSYVVDKFKSMPSPAVLLSPSVTTGWDFPASKTGIRYAIAAKVPYPDTLDPVTKARHEDDKEWTNYLAMETLVQEASRLSRGPEDKAEIFIVDDNISWFLKSSGKFAPGWFKRRYRGRMDLVPDPLV